MASTENKTKPTDVSVDTFLKSVKDDQRRSDSQQLCELMEKISGEKAVMWGPSIIGFGQYHYKYASGREGDSGLLGFSPRANNITIYFVDGTSKYQEALKDLGPHKTGKVCLYIKRLSDIDMAVLEKLIKASHDYVKANIAGK